MLTSVPSIYVKSINLFPAISYILKFLAFDHAIGNCPCIDLDSYFLSLFINLVVPGAGIEVEMVIFFVFIIFFCIKIPCI